MTSKTMPCVTICADDYGLAPGVSLAIRDLIANGRLQATGCMVGSSHWPAEAQLLKPLEGQADIGLHFTLTDQRPLGAMPRLAPEGRFPNLGTLLKRALLRGLDKAEIAAELERQLDAFEAAFGRPPDFIDGHHHIHQLPVVRDTVVEAWHNRLKGKGWIRSCWEPPFDVLARQIDPGRTLVIASLGLRMRRLLERHNIPHNRSFRGVYDLSDRWFQSAFDLSESVPYSQLFHAFTDRPGDKTLVMCHPGLVDDALKSADSVTYRREREYTFLKSDACLNSLQWRGIHAQRLFPVEAQ